MRKPRPITPAAPDDAAEFIAAKSNRIFSILTQILLLHPNNRWLVFSPYLTNQVKGAPKAAQALDAVRQATFGFELIRIMSLWDRAAKDRDSIPSIYDALCKPEIQEVVRRRYMESWEAMDLSPAMLAKQIKHYDRAMARLRRIVPAVIKSRRHIQLRDYRDSYIAHNLPDPVSGNPRYGQETRLLKTTVKIAGDLALVLRNASEDYGSTERFAKTYADILWSNMRFEGDK